VISKLHPAHVRALNLGSRHVGGFHDIISAKAKDTDTGAKDPRKEGTTYGQSARLRGDITPGSPGTSD